MKNIPNLFKFLQIIQHNKWPLGRWLERPVSKGISLIGTSNLSALNTLLFDDPPERYFS